MRELNNELHNIPEGSNDLTWEILNPLGTHAIAAGIDDPVVVDVKGNAGYYCGGMNSQGTITVHGSAGSGVGENMMSGKIVVKGDVSQYAGATGTGRPVCAYGRGRVGDHRPDSAHLPRQRVWSIVAKASVLASGVVERSLVFGGNDRPGIMLASARPKQRREQRIDAGQIEAQRRTAVLAPGDQTIEQFDIGGLGIRLTLRPCSDFDESIGLAVDVTSARSGRDSRAGHLKRRSGSRKARPKD